MRTATMLESERLALERLLNIAQDNAGPSRRVADFLLAWWNPSMCGGHELTAA